MLKVVLDTNVLISSIINTNGIPSKILNSWRQGNFMLITSPHLLKEVRRVIHYPHIKDRYQLTEQIIKRLLWRIENKTIFAPGKLELKVIEKHPADDRVLEAGVEGDADYIVSGNDHLTDLKAYQGIQIVLPRDFFEILRKSR